MSNGGIIFKKLDTDNFLLDYAFQARLAYLRTQRNITQPQLAKFLDIDRRTVGHYENGRAEPSMKKMRNIAKFFDVSIDYLYCIDEPTQKALNDFLNNPNRNDFISVEDINEIIKSISYESQ